METHDQQQFNDICGLYYGLYSHFLESSYHKWMLDFIKSFFCIYWNDHMLSFYSHFVNVVYHTDLWILKNPCISGINPTWSWWMTLLMYCWIQFASILLRIFASIFISISSVQFLSCVQLFATLMASSTSGFPVYQQLPEPAQACVHRVSDAIQPSHPLSSPSPSV